MAFAALLLTPAALAQPINDSIFEAMPIAADGIYTGTNAGADAEPFNNPTATCTSTDNGEAVWWVFKVEEDAAITIDLAGSTFDTVLSIAQVGSELEEIACDDDGIPGDGILTSRIENFAAQAGRRYFVRVVGFNSAEGDIAMAVTSQATSGGGTALTTPPYDSFGIGRNLNLNDNGAVDGLDNIFPETNVGATSEAGETAASCTSIDLGNSTWRTFAPTQNGFITIDLAGSTFDTVLSIRTDIGTEVACDDDGLPGDGILTSRIENFRVVAGTVYHIRVTGFNNASGDIRMRVVGSTTAVVSEPATPEASLTLLAPFPNPASGAVRLAADLPEPADVRLTVYDALGREVAVLAEGTLAAGQSDWTWDASGQPAGVYIVRLSSGEEVRTRRVTVVR
ncbi:hypothetical protein BSZ36_00580 [Rubricoccus marinus]|uniref:FlgD/Vpr Ig-like domain-containing protein n=1 Tax=Rubricoccus marinus TaxID=716817 RepID=A0A259TVN4_9BACT|nr:hypothetical protein BSZ36_00580 [Rubricoccus marinus]